MPNPLPMCIRSNSSSVLHRYCPTLAFSISLFKGPRGVNLTRFLESETRHKASHVTFHHDAKGKLPSAKMLTEFVRSNALPTLHSITLLVTQYQETQLQKLGESFQLPVQSLTLRGWNDDAEMKCAFAFFRGFKPPELTKLKIGSNKIGVRGVKMMARWPVLSDLDSLDVSYGRLRDRGLEELCLLESLENLSGLNLQGNQLTDEGIETFVNAESFAKLRILNLFDNRITLWGVRTLASCSKLSTLKSLNVGWNAIYKNDLLEVKRILAASPYFAGSISN